jgi:hypothetical protein
LTPAATAIVSRAMRAQQHMRRGAAGLALLATAAVVATGCSSEKKAAPADAGVAALSIVTDHDVAATRRHTPERVVMTWWQLAQYRDVNDSRALFNAGSRAELDRAGYAVLLVRYLGPWIRNGKPRIIRVQKVGPNHVIVFAETTFNVAVGTDLVRHNKDVVSFSLDRAGHTWQIADPSWVLQTAGGLKDQAQAAQRAAAQNAQK